MRCYIVTGASRGLGLALARDIAAQGHQLIALARQESPELATIGAAASGYRFVAIDLADIAQTSDTAEELMGSLAAVAWQGIYLINNAGLVKPVAPAGRYDDAALMQCLNVNLSSAIVLANAFLRHFQHHAGDKCILNISSGAGRNAYQSWSAYCTAKAGLDMYSRCVGVEQQREAKPVRIAAIAPGIIDTGMQADIRAAEVADFPQLAQFVDYHRNGDLTPAAQCASEILGLLHSQHVGVGELLDVRSFR
ncbi:SDR family NAD(P)-dependent oxidoreductase [Chitinimonas sp. BJYL2]|uniref:SDR family NAD(P)-dependent oxidoreductase n=1 Tax=Chitinimonas sp. BJYL2 TaxID=2976696 RepID=UPI0022B479CE|nr:SDR family NAD(P)-dependent oxidoreductase [Chitinimonas sp. BJYL2]